MELLGFDLHFTNTKIIKSAAMADFLAEWTPTPSSEEEPCSSLPGSEDEGRWTVYFDGSFSFDGAGAGVLIVSPTGEQLKYVLLVAFLLPLSKYICTTYLRCSPVGDTMRMPAPAPSYENEPSK